MSDQTPEPYDVRVDWSFRMKNGFVPERWGSRAWAEGVIQEESEREDGIPLTLVRRTVTFSPWEEA